MKKKSATSMARDGQENKLRKLVKDSAETAVSLILKDIGEKHGGLREVIIVVHKKQIRDAIVSAIIIRKRKPSVSVYDGQELLDGDVKVDLFEEVGIGRT